LNADASPNAAQRKSPESSFCTRGFDGTILPALPIKAQSQRPVSSERSFDLELHIKTHQKQKLQVKRKEVKKQPEPPINLEEGRTPYLVKRNIRNGLRQVALSIAEG
jgi:hypothetical protein